MDTGTFHSTLIGSNKCSWSEICEITGWTYTKVNRCLTEGRRAPTIRLAGIEAGIECARLAPLLEALADDPSKGKGRGAARAPPAELRQLPRPAKEIESVSTRSAGWAAPPCPPRCGVRSGRNR